MELLRSFSCHDVGRSSFVSYAQIRVPTLTIYTGLGTTTTYYISPFFDREFPEAVLKIAKFIQAQLKLNVHTKWLLSGNPKFSKLILANYINW